MTEIITIAPARKPPGRKTKPQKGDKKYGKSAVTNGDLLPNIDGRLAIARRYKDLVASITADHNTAKLQLIKRFAAASCLAELLEARLAAGEDINAQDIALLASTSIRLANKIGIDHVAKNTEPTFGDMMQRVESKP
jgi:hypothetical protein